MAQSTRGIKKSLVAVLAIALTLSGAARAWGFFADNAASGSTFSTATFVPPTNVSGQINSCVKGGGPQSVLVSWTATVSTAATGYEVLRSTTSGGPYQVVESVAGRTTTSFVDSTVVGATTYFYVVRSTRNLWRSAYSGQAQIQALNPGCQ